MRIRVFAICVLMLGSTYSCTSKSSNQTSVTRSDTSRAPTKSVPIIPPCKEDGTLVVIRNGRDTLIVIPVEIVSTENGRSLGMMYREAMSDSCGMLFLFEREQPLSFWMHNTVLSLDMFFIRADGRIATIHEYTIPFDDGKYPASENCMYVLETTAGFRARHGLKVGDRMTFVRH